MVQIPDGSADFPVASLDDHVYEVSALTGITYTEDPPQDAGSGSDGLLPDEAQRGEDASDAGQGEAASPQSPTSETVTSEATHVPPTAPPMAYALVSPAVAERNLGPIRSVRSGPVPHGP